MRIAKAHFLLQKLLLIYPVPRPSSFWEIITCSRQSYCAVKRRDLRNYITQAVFCNHIFLRRNAFLCCPHKLEQFILKAVPFFLVPLLPIGNIQPFRYRSFALSKALIKRDVSVWIIKDIVFPFPPQEITFDGCGCSRSCATF